MVNLKPCGLDANCCSSAFLVEGELWEDGSLYLVDDEDQGIFLVECNVFEREGYQTMEELNWFNIPFSTFEALIG